VADVLDPRAGILEVHPCGFFDVDRSKLMALPDEIVCRVLARAVAAAGGAGQPVPLAGLEAILAELSSTRTGAWTLARARVATAPERLLIEREPGRDALPTLVLVPGSVEVWDGRFRVSTGHRFEGAVEVRALGVEGVRELRARVDVATQLPVASLRATPSFWRGIDLLAVPPLDFRSGAEAGELRATFLALAGCGVGG
jgi:hypothetical protein